MLNASVALRPCPACLVASVFRSLAGITERGASCGFRPGAIICVTLNAILLTVHWILTPRVNSEHSNFTSPVLVVLPHAYNKAVRDNGLESIRNMNRVDASGRPLPKDQD